MDPTRHLCPGAGKLPSRLVGMWGICAVCGRECALFPKHNVRFDERVVWQHKTPKLQRQARTFWRRFLSSFGRGWW